MTTLDGGRIGIAAQAVGIAQAAFEAARDYALERRQFGKPIAELPGDPAQARRHVDGDRRGAAARATGGVAEAAGAAARARRARRRSCSPRRWRGARPAEAIQILGGYGYTKEFPVERYYRDAKITEIYEGTSEIQRLVIARSILGLRQRQLASG